MLLRNLLIILLIGFHSGGLVAQEIEESRKPLEAVLLSMSWANVLSKDHDVTATVHFGEQEDARFSTSNEGVYKSRQIFDSQSGEFWIPYARGTFELTLDNSSKDVAPIDRRHLGIVVGQRDEAQETSFNRSPTRMIRKTNAITVANPIDLLFIATNPFAFSPQQMGESTKAFETVLARLESNEPGQLRCADEQVDRRKVKVYRVKGTALPTSEMIPTNKIVVSNEGFDQGRVLEISQDFMKLGDTAAYENDRQLVAPFRKKCRIHWKQFEVEDQEKKKVTMILPVSLTKNHSDQNFKAFSNVSFEWNSFDKPKNDLRTIESGEKIAKEFDQQINKVLNR